MRRDFDHWYHQYNPLVKNTLYEHGISPEDIEDRCQDVWAAFFAGGYDKLYTPSKGSESNFVFNFVERRCRGWRGQQSRDKLRQALRLVTGGVVEGAYDISLDNAVEISVEMEDDIDFRVAVQAAHRALQDLPVAGKRDFARLFRMFIDGYTQREIATRLDVAEGTVSNYVKMLREVPEVSQLREQFLAA